MHFQVFLTPLDNVVITGWYGAQFVHRISLWYGLVVNWVLELLLEILMFKNQKLLDDLFDQTQSDWLLDVRLHYLSYYFVDIQDMAIFISCNAHGFKCNTTQA